MKKENVLKVIAVSLICPLLYFALQIFVNVVWTFGYGAIHAAERQSDLEAFKENFEAATAASSMYFLLIALVLFLVIVFVTFKIRGKKLLERVQWRPVHHFSIYVLVAIAAVTDVISQNLLAFTVVPDNILEDATNYTETVTSGGILLILAITVLLGPIVEETIFRGFMMARLQMRFPLWFAVALTALLFSAMHSAGGIAQLIGTLWGGLFFCLIFSWTKSLRASVLAHVVNNAVVSFVPLGTIIIPMSLPVKLILFVVGLAATVFVLSLIYRRRDKGNASAVA